MKVVLVLIPLLAGTAVGRLYNLPNRGLGYQQRPTFSNNDGSGSQYEANVSILDPEEVERWKKLMAEMDRKLYGIGENYTRLRRGPSYIPSNEVVYGRVHLRLPSNKPKVKSFSSNGFGLGKRGGF